METPLSTEGIIFMIFGWSSVLALVTFCMWKVMTTKTDLEEAAEEFENEK